MSAAAAKPGLAGGALRDAGLSALVALGLFGPMIGLKTESSESGLTLIWRPVAVAVAASAGINLL